ncbi:SCO family protein [Paracoccus aestuarii]|uniref:SCO family protein n=1 Tax=Paracoccus aestuarii TaxID=453842 RepID=A0A418ZVU1_9RHOB|nr:SCO family protein [Paracoccus aestuarii]RJL04097.1 SCO family protein [Paracoccus aestuarii]WCQ99291.1 SCO family protein [Paracoccus aestuarii]
MADRKILLIGTAAAIGVLAGGALFLTMRGGDDRFAQCSSSAVAGGMDAFGTDFTLTRDDGRRVTSAEVFDKPSLLYFGYTFCPDVCPLDAARNAEAEALVQEAGHDVQTVFVTVDPRRDTPEVLADYTSLFSDTMIGLTGTDEEIAAVNRGWRNYYKAHDEEDQEYYLVDHMTNTYLVMPGGKTVEFFSREADPERMAETVACYAEAA